MKPFKTGPVQEPRGLLLRAGEEVEGRSDPNRHETVLVHQPLEYDVLLRSTQADPDEVSLGHAKPVHQLSDVRVPELAEGRGHPAHHHGGREVLGDPVSQRREAGVGTCHTGSAAALAARAIRRMNNGQGAGARARRAGKQ